MKKKYIFTILFIALLAYLFLTRFDFHELMDSLTRIPLLTVALLVVIQILSQLLLNVQWHTIAVSGGSRLSFWDMLYINSQAEIVHGIPGGHVGSDITRFVQLSRIGNCSGPQAASAVAAQKLFSLSTFFFVNLFAAGFLIGKVPLLQERYLQVALYGIVIICLLLFASMFIMPRHILSYLNSRDKPRNSWACKVRKFMTALFEQIISIRQNTKTLVSFLLLAALIWLLYPLKMYLLAVQFAPDISIAYISATVFVSYMVAMIPIFPGGLGGFEAAMTGLLLLAGFTPSDALALTVVFRFVTFWFVLLLSVMYIGYHKIKYP